MLSDVAKAACVKIIKHEGNPRKAQVYFAALIGLGVKPEQLPKRVLVQYKKHKLVFNREKMLLVSMDRPDDGYCPADAARKLKSICPEVNVMIPMLFRMYFPDFTN